MQGAVGGFEPLDRLNLPATDRVRQDRARIVRDIVDEHGARAALRTVAAQLRAGEPQLVAERHCQRFLLHHVNGPHLAVDVQGHQPLDGPGHRALSYHGGSPEQVRRTRYCGTGGNHTFDEGAARDGIFVFLRAKHGAALPTTYRSNGDRGAYPTKRGTRRSTKSTGGTPRTSRPLSA